MNDRGFNQVEIAAQSGGRRMTVTSYAFNRSPVLIHEPIPDLNPELIEGTPNLRRASLANSALFGGALLKRCLESAPLVGDREHILVDTKVSLLMPGWMPAIPGWHTDGVPRGLVADPAGTGEPSMTEQQRQHDSGYFPRFHSIVVGNPCLTEFINHPLTLLLHHGEDSGLYAEMTRVVDTYKFSITTPSADRWTSWNWWNIHRATEARKRGWRLHIRVTESNTPPAESGFIRAQNQVYVPREFGW